MRCENNHIFTNYGYYFNKIDTTNLSTVWSYSPAANPSSKEVSTFEIKNDSVFFFEKDSTAVKNCYTVFVKNKLTGANIPYTSITALGLLSSLGCIEGYINNSVLINNTIVLSGVFTASISGVQVARNLVTIDIATGQLQVPPVTFLAGSSILDMKLINNKLYLGGKFTDVNGQTRNNFAVLDLNLNLLSENIQFTGFFDPPSSTWIDKICSYDKYLIVKGNFAVLNGNILAGNNAYWVKIIDTENNNAIIPWTINLPGTPVMSDYAFAMFKNKLYIKNKPSIGSPFHIYCFEPVVKSTNILFPGSTIASPIPSIAICAPDNGNANIFIAPIRYATTYNWMYSGANATIIPQGNGSTAKLVVTNNTTNGLLSVSGSNDCGLLTGQSTLNVIINSTPTFTLPLSPQNIICNPDSTLLQGTASNSNCSIWWRKAATTTINPQPFYSKNPGNYYMVVLDNANSCKDSGTIIVKNMNAFPNAKISSHIYPGAVIPIDTVTCYKPLVNIIPAQNNLKIIVTRNNNNCVDSSLIVLVGQNTVKPTIAITNSVQSINCSYYTATLNAAYSPSYCSGLWNGPLSYTAANPSNANYPGVYYFTATDPVNGCARLDSTSVISSNYLALKSSNDTTVCKQSPLTLRSVRIGTLAGVTYSWNTGGVTNSVSINPAATTNFIVFANGPGGCYGTDTIKVTIPSDLQDSVIAYRSCDNSQTGSILMFAKGGIPPYKYSVNNGSFLSSNSFTNLPYANYNLVVKDSIGCLNTSSVSLNGNSNLPVPKFLASTKNFKRDTIVLVDISIPKADSVQWLLPQQASIIGGNMYSPVITISDTGSFVITMKAFYGACIINSTKLIQFNLMDSLQATYNNANGIKKFILYPNPTTGLFTVEVEFYKKQNASIQAWDAAPYIYLQQNFYNVDTIILPVNLNQLQNGAYILRVIGEYDAKNKSFIISK
ncbi:MAG: SprB repeat-containing protein [Bacteroidetes bacterium]|nr:SprB repeat-containing protein [Bacteroidota bacterium]